MKSSRFALWSQPRSWLLVIAALAIAVPAVAQAQGDTLAILGLTSKDGDDDAAAELTDALRSAAASDSALQLSDSNPSLAQLVVLHDCEIADAECREVIARQLEVNELIYGAIRRSEAGHRVELHRYATTDGGLSHASRELAIDGASDEELAREARSLLRELRGDETPEPVALAPAPTVKRRPVIRPLPLSAPVEPEPQEREASSNDWLGYTLLGVAAVSAGLTVFSWSEIDAARNDGDFRAYREAVGRATNGAVDDVCAEADAGETYGLEASRLKGARNACSRGVTFEILQWVFMGSALVSTGVGIYVLLDDEGEPDSARASLLPMIGKDDAGLQLRIQL